MKVDEVLFQETYIGFDDFYESEFLLHQRYVFYFSGNVQSTINDMKFCFNIDKKLDSVNVMDKNQKVHIFTDLNDKRALFQLFLRKIPSTIKMRLLLNGLEFEELTI